jgi:hypothetical protein
VKDTYYIKYGFQKVAAGFDVHLVQVEGKKVPTVFGIPLFSVPRKQLRPMKKIKDRKIAT